jgi:hypothetical protein
MTKKIKIKTKDIPATKAVYPIRCGTIVNAIVWLDHVFIAGKVTQTYSITQLDEPGAQHWYDIEIANGEIYEMILEDDVFITKRELKEMVEAHLTISMEVD